MTKPVNNVEGQGIEPGQTRVTITEYMRIAARLMAALERITAAIPGFGEGREDSLRFVRRKVGVPRRFVRDAVNMLVAIDELEMARQMDGGASVDAAQYLDAFLPLKMQLRAAYRGLDIAMKIKEAELTSKAQKIYGITRELARDANNPALDHTVQQLRSARKRPPGRRPRTKKAATKG